MEDKLVVYTVRISVVKDGMRERQSYEVQVRDLALAISLLLSDQKLADYGFVDRYATSSSAATRSYSYSRYYFPDNEARSAAFKKWAKWRKAHLDE